MKQVLLTTIALCSAFLPIFGQEPMFEYVQYQKYARRNTIQLPEFSVPLKRTYREERSVHRAASKIFVVSDIEGQYEYFKRLLISGGVIDSQFNWTFGRGNLVVCGDVFDRGSQVAECLWLIYYLEDKARGHGGLVHYILGNHELMNLNKDYRYVNPKYLELARQKSIPYEQFYSWETELGRWLRSKNVMEKIGDLLFVHAGVSQYINELGKDIDSINMLARNYYDEYDSSIPAVAQLLLLDDGPLWYRGYFMDPKATQNQVDSTLKLFGVKKIILGHTPVKHISTFYDNKIINVDVPHALGVSEGLLIENGKYFGVDFKGGRTLLLEE